MKLLVATAAVLVAQAAALVVGGKSMVVKKDSDGLQDIVSCRILSMKHEVVDLRLAGDL